MADVPELIAKLRQHVGATNDAELARRIDVDKSTISSWRSRGRVPAKYLSLLSGAVGDQFLAAPSKWGPFEYQVMQFALFRFSAVMGLQPKSKKFQHTLLCHNRASHRWWLLMNDCQRELVEIGLRWENGLHGQALFVAIHSYREDFERRSKADSELILGMPE